jgi:hypothetical protein
MTARYVLRKGRSVPRSHLYDYGEESIYMGPPRRQFSRGVSYVIGFIVCCPLYCFVIKELLGS